MDVPRTPSYNEHELVIPGAPIMHRRNPNLAQRNNMSQSNLQPRRLFSNGDCDDANEKIAKQKPQI